MKTLFLVGSCEGLRPPRPAQSFDRVRDDQDGAPSDSDVGAIAAFDFGYES